MKNHSISIKAKTPSQRERILARLRKTRLQRNYALFLP